MDFFEVVERRHSVRDFDTSKDVSEDQVLRILECARRAPSAGNVQPWRFHVVRDPEIKERLAYAALGQHFVQEAPVLLVICADLKSHLQVYGRRGVELYSIQDTAAAAENILLAACAMGLGACWVGAFRESEAAAALGLEEGIRPLALIPIGYEKGEPLRPNRLDLDKVTIFQERQAD